MTTNIATARFAALTLGKEVGFVNPRQTSGLDARNLDDLAADIAEKGITDPLHAWTMEHEGKEVHVVLRGQRRYRAIERLVEKKTAAGARVASNIPVLWIMCEDMAAAELYAANELAHAVPPSTFEMAEYMAHLRSTRKLEQQEIAARLNRSEAWVSRILGAYKAATPELKEVWAKGKIPDQDAKDLAKVPKEKQPEAVADYLAERDKGDRRSKSHAKAKLAEKVKESRPAARSAPPSCMSPGQLRDMYETLDAIKPTSGELLGMYNLAKWAVGGLSSSKFPKSFHDAVKEYNDSHFKLGEAVTWKSQANGNWATKKGNIIEVVAPGKKPKQYDKYNGTTVRDHESYVVEIEGSGETGWPVVSGVSRAKG